MPGLVVVGPPAIRTRGVKLENSAYEVGSVPTATDMRSVGCGLPLKVNKSRCCDWLMTATPLIEAELKAVSAVLIERPGLQLDSKYSTQFSLKTDLSRVLTASFEA